MCFVAFRALPRDLDCDVNPFSRKLLGSDPSWSQGMSCMSSVGTVCRYPTCPALIEDKA